MGLSKKSIETAWFILNEINPMANNSFVEEYDKNEEFKQHKILGIDKKHDGGWENIYINILDITPEQIHIFERRKHQVPNTPFMRHKINGISRLGWI